MARSCRGCRGVLCEICGGCIEEGECGCGNAEEKIAACGHLERFTKVEVNQDAWCALCALERMALENNRLRRELEKVVNCA